MIAALDTKKKCHDLYVFARKGFSWEAEKAYMVNGTGRKHPESLD